MSGTISRSKIALIALVVFMVASMVMATGAFAGKRTATPTIATGTSTVTITVQSVTGRMVTGATVVLDGDKSNFRGTTGTDGKVTFTGVPFGSYYSHVTHSLFRETYRSVLVQDSTVLFTHITYPVSLWEGIGY